VERRFDLHGCRWWAIIVAVSGMAVSGCHAMYTVPPSAITASGAPARLWVTGLDHETVIIDSPSLEGDTLTGLFDGEPVHFALSQTTALRTSRTAPVRTAATVLAVGAVTFAGLWYMQHRPFVGNAQFCGNALSSGSQPPMPLVSCCPAVDSVPC